MNLKAPFAFIQKDFTTYRQYKLSFILDCISIFVFVLTNFYLSKMISNGKPTILGQYGSDYFTFVILGLILQLLMYTSITAFSFSIKENRVHQSLEHLFLTPHPSILILLYSGLWPLVLTSVRILIYILFATFLGFTIHIQHIFLCVLILVLSVLSFLSIGLLSAAYTLTYKRGDPVVYLINVSSILLSGVYYPTEILPKSLSCLANTLPMTHALKALRTLFMSESSWLNVQNELLSLSLFVFISLPITVLMWNYAYDRVRKDGSMGFS